MLRFFAGAGSALLLVVAGFFLWKSRAEQEPLVPPAPLPATYALSLRQNALPAPPAASEKTKEQKRFARADKDEDGRVSRDELMAPRRKAFARLDGNGDGRLSFEEWAAKTIEKFEGADGDKSGWLDPREYAATKPKARAKGRCAC